MALTITIDLSPAEEEQLQKAVVARNVDDVREILLNALTPKVSKLFSRPNMQINTCQYEDTNHI